MIFCLSHRQELSTRSGWQLVYGMLVLLLLLACESDLTQLVESRHNVLDSPSTLGIRVRSPLAWGRNSVRELRVRRRHGLVLCIFRTTWLDSNGVTFLFVSYNTCTRRIYVRSGYLL